MKNVMLITEYEDVNGCILKQRMIRDNGKIISTISVKKPGEKFGKQIEIYSVKEDK